MDQGKEEVQWEAELAYCDHWIVKKLWGAGGRRTFSGTRERGRVNIGMDELKKRCQSLKC